MNSIEAKKTGRPHTPNRQGLYAKVAKFAELAIDSLVELMKNSKNDNIRLGAAKALLDKCLPDVKAIELDTQQPEKIQIELVAEKPFKQVESEYSKTVNIGNGLVPVSASDDP